VVEHFLGKEEVVSSILINSSKIDLVGKKGRGNKILILVRPSETREETAQVALMMIERKEKKILLRPNDSRERKKKKEFSK
jgi:hypothetical protein